ncbi:MAG: hypothetical protein ACNA8W_22410 [Bradymonadaceae bacterium]
MNYELYIVWGASIYALVAAIKALAKANGLDKHPVYVRSLPIIPAVIGVVSGALVGPSVFDLPPVHGAFFGIGAAGAAALSHSVHRQTIRGHDDRLRGGDDA